ncbi:MAG: universal stress protein [Lentisphaerae bacterium]|nr:universal stress protein [Lentisphaerota bacterium]
MDTATQIKAWYRKILVCTDFSKNAGLAFELAVNTAMHHRGSTLTLLHVLQEPDAQFWKNYIYDVENVDGKARKEIDRRIEEEYLPKVPESLEFNTVFKVGNPAQMILDYAKEEEFDLIVVGRLGRGSIFFGNVASRIARYAECPVIIVPLAFADKWSNRTAE